MSEPPFPDDPSLEDLLIVALDRLEAEGAAGVERFLAEHPGPAPRLRSYLESLHRMGLAESQEASVPGHPARPGDSGAPQGPGGLGAFYRAVHESLGREAALKLIRSDRLEALSAGVGLVAAVLADLPASLANTPPEDVLPVLEAAASAVERALVVAPDDPIYRRTCRSVYQAEAELALGVSDHARAVASARRLMEPRLAPNQPALVAGFLARAMPLAVADEALSQAARNAVAAAYRQEATVLLQQALAGGRTLADLRADPALAEQWGKPAFEELCKELEGR